MKYKKKEGKKMLWLIDYGCILSDFALIIINKQKEEEEHAADVESMSLFSSNENKIYSFIRWNILLFEEVCFLVSIILM